MIDSQPAARRGFSPATVALTIAVWLAAMLTYDYYVRIERPRLEARIEAHSQIVAGTAPYQYRYRILMPQAAEVLARGLQHLPVLRSQPPVAPLAYGTKAFLLSYCLLNFAGFALFFVCQIRLIALFYRFELALLGGVISALLVNFTFRDHYFHPWSIWEGAFFALGLILIQLRMHWRFLALSLAALLNRETSLFLVLMFLLRALPRSWSKDQLGRFLRSTEVRFAVASVALWVVGFFALHQAVGYRPSTFFIQTAREMNFDRANWLYAILLNVLLVGILVPLTLAGLRIAPRLIRRAAWVLPAYFGLLLVIGLWWEIRYWISVLPVIVTALIGGISRSVQPDTSTRLEARFQPHDSEPSPPAPEPVGRLR